MILKFPLEGEPPSPPYGHVYKSYRAVATKSGPELVSFYPWWQAPDHTWKNRGSFPFFDNFEEAEDLLRENGFQGVVRRWDLERAAWGGEHPIVGGPWFPWRNLIVVCEIKGATHETEAAVAGAVRELDRGETLRAHVPGGAEE